MEAETEGHRVDGCRRAANGRESRRKARNESEASGSRGEEGAREPSEGHDCPPWTIPWFGVTPPMADDSRVFDPVRALPILKIYSKNNALGREAGIGDGDADGSLESREGGGGRKTDRLRMEVESSARN